MSAALGGVKFSIDFKAVCVQFTHFFGWELYSLGRRGKQKKKTFSIMMLFRHPTYKFQQIDYCYIPIRVVDVYKYLFALVNVVYIFIKKILV